MRNEKNPAKKQGFLGAFDRRGPRCVDALWTLKETNPYVSNDYRENEITIPVFPHMMWGFFFYLQFVILLLAYCFKPSVILPAEDSGSIYESNLWTAG
ncbi:hypothetical protein FGH87_15320 [Salmonella enterica]|uniref:Uncharacterized protein n=1 Tax=Salmonella enterica subsp. enterica serovar Lattenkamp TaxID=2564671 RepID=A0A5W2LQM7_SALET|nr:hypothetical protein [Salmonella enterica subsp. enterica serovar Lattenkamp]EAQ8607202.1 hypothetical protein [Salmonella enterica]ECJ3922370.1 hypothetical protein [Salmonella enterica subsp. enterica]EAR5595859.1 hypothetical protein [Salmonella enterica]EAV2733563.1 hypothetical protein [Salmonella enterica]